jgi:hypothetical protein
MSGFSSFTDHIVKAHDLKFNYGQAGTIPS